MAQTRNAHNSPHLHPFALPFAATFLHQQRLAHPGLALPMREIVKLCQYAWGSDQRDFTKAFKCGFYPNSTDSGGRKHAPWSSLNDRHWLQVQSGSAAAYVGKVQSTWRTNSPPSNPCIKEDARSKSVALSSVRPIMSNLALPDCFGFPVHPCAGACVSKVSTCPQKRQKAAGRTIIAFLCCIFWYEDGRVEGNGRRCC